MIDACFVSLARNFGQNVIGIILSGTGDDGVPGIREIAGAGGFVMAQDPATARFGHMPANAQRTGCVHRSLPPESMGRAIEAYLEQCQPSHNTVSSGSLPEDTHLLIRTLQQEYDVNLSEDDHFIVLRTVEARVTALNLTSAAEYTGYVEAHPTELDELYRELQTELVQNQLPHLVWMTDRNSDASMIVNAHGTVVYANQTFTRRLGRADGDWLNLRLEHFDLRHHQAEFPQRFEDCRLRGGIVVQTVHRTVDGRSLPTEMAATHVELQQRDHLFCVVRDRENERLEAKVAPDDCEEGPAETRGIVICDASNPEYPITFASDSFYRMTGYSAEETLGQNCRFLQGNNTSSQTIAEIRAAVTAEMPCRVLIENYRKNGDSFWNDLSVVPVKDSAGRVTHFVGVQDDATRRLQLEERSRHSERTIRLILDSTAEGIVGIDSKGRCTFCNSAAVKLLGYESAAELVGHRFQAVVQQDVREEPDLEQVLRTGEGTEYPGQHFRRANGDQVPVDIRCHPMLEAGRCIGGVITFLDDSERRQREHQLHVARSRAELANEAKSEFLANVSHELRTPLAAILGFARIINEQYNDAGLREKVHAIQRNGDYLLTLLGDILDLSRIEAGRLEVRRTTVDVQDLFSDIYRTMRMRAESHQTNLRFRSSGPLPQTITTDAARLRQIVINLVANAIKFTPVGEVEVTVCCLNPSTEKEMLQVEVQDSGIGISPTQLEGLFEPFTQADATIGERFGGTGLGLSISRRLARSLGGQIEARSTEGVGSTFTVVIPAAPAGSLMSVDLERARGDKLPLDRETGTETDEHLGCRILIADDMRDVRDIASHFLRKAGAEVEVAKNGEQAVEAVTAAANRGEQYSLVLMDLQMPVMNGPSAVRSLRDLGIDIPIVALTADAMKGTRERVLQLGFSEYLTKPIHAEELIRTVRRLIEC
ncbi:MAG: hypothetical protein Fues2KO_04550 [Fuerstiella sp.]